MRFTIETETEEDGRWIAEIAELPGVMQYGRSRDEAIARAEALALRVRHGFFELRPGRSSMSADADDVLRPGFPPVPPTLETES